MTWNPPPEFSVWSTMKTRCYNPNAWNYKYYGGRGVAVCQRWLDSFDNFYADMGSRPTAQHKLERENNNLGYGPDNCIWTTQKLQCRNRSNGRYVEYKGRRMTVAELAESVGIRQTVLYLRLFTLGWDMDSALFTPVRKKIMKPEKGN